MCFVIAWSIVVQWLKSRTPGGGCRSLLPRISWPKEVFASTKNLSKGSYNSVQDNNSELVEVKELTKRGEKDAGQSSFSDDSDSLEAVASASVDERRRFFAEHDTTDEDEDGERRVKKGEANGGTGACLMVNSLGKRRTFHDGCGLCSPGRWQPRRRICRQPSF
eukprot:9086722-Karenia_brevis.AAC.1